MIVKPLMVAMMLIAVSANATSVKLSGIRFGALPWAAGSEYDKASDENISTFFDASSASEGYAGNDQIHESSKQSLPHHHPHRAGGSYLNGRQRHA